MGRTQRCARNARFHPSLDRLPDQFCRSLGRLSDQLAQHWADLWANGRHLRGRQRHPRDGALLLSRLLWRWQRAGEETPVAGDAVLRAERLHAVLCDVTGEPIKQSA